MKIDIIIGNLNTNIRYWSLKILCYLYQWISSRIIRQYFIFYYDAQPGVDVIMLEPLLAGNKSVNLFLFWSIYMYIPFLIFPNLMKVFLQFLFSSILVANLEWISHNALVFLGISPMQKEVLLSHKLWDHAYEYQNPFEL